MANESRSSLTRRDMMRASFAAGVGLAAANAVAGELPKIEAALAGAKPFRVAHLTDMHVEPERRAGEGYIAALESLDKLDPKPDLIITGGDHVMDSTDQSLERAKLQWGVYQRAMGHTKIPVRSLLGNHDIFGWGVKEMPDTTIGYGRALACDQLQLSKSYYSFDAGGWHFIAIDSMSRHDNTYLGLLDREQFEWLKADLEGAGTTTPVVIFSHIPLLSVCVFFDGADRIGDSAWNVPDSYMHRDTPALLDLFAKYNVRLLVSGHIHLVDRAEYRGMTFICDGAVSGNWWKGPRQQFPEGYGIIDFHPDGRFDHQYASYGWKAENA